MDTHEQLTLWDPLPGEPGPVELDVMDQIDPVVLYEGIHTQQMKLL